MYILFVSSGLGSHLGGAPISEASLARALQEKIPVKILCPVEKYSPEFSKQFGIEVESFKALDVMKAWLGVSNSITDLLKKASLIHINGHWRWENFFWARLAHRNLIPFILHPRGMCLVGHRRVKTKKIFNRLIGNYVVQGASRVICLSHYESDQLTPYHIKSTRVEVVPNGIDTKNSNTKEQPQFILYFGRLESRKNLLFLLEAFSVYRKRGGKFPLVLMGPVERGYDALIREKAKVLGLESEVELRSPLFGEAKWETVRRSLAVVYPASDEPFGRVPFEALSVGVPAIVPRKSGAAEYLEPYLRECVYPENTGALAEALIKVEKARTRGEEIGVEAAMGFIHKELNWEVIRDRVLSIYEKCSRGT